MGVGGAIKKLIIAGLAYELSSDNDINFTVGGTYITESQLTTKGPFFLADKVAGAAKGLELRAAIGDTDLDNFDKASQQSVVAPVSALIVFANGSKYTAAGGARIIISGAADGMVTSREGKLSFDLIPEKGEWTKA